MYYVYIVRVLVRKISIVGVLKKKSIIITSDRARESHVVGFHWTISDVSRLFTILFFFFY